MNELKIIEDKPYIALETKLQESEQYSAQIEVELSHLKFLKELKKFDEDPNVQQQQQQQQHIPLININNNNSASNDENVTLVADGKKMDMTFPEDEEDQSQANCMYKYYIMNWVHFYSIK
jgi:hypothetical protein